MDYLSSDNFYLVLIYFFIIYFSMKGGLRMSVKRNVNEGPTSDYNIEHRKVSQAKSMPFHHYHNNYEIYYLLSGERYYFIKDKIYHVQKGDLILINTNDLHRTTNVHNPKYERIVLNFTKNFISGYNNHIKGIDLFECFEQKTNILKVQLQSQHFLETLFFKMIREYQDKDKGYYTYLKILTIELLLFINRNNDRVNDYNFNYVSPAHKIISEIATYINQNYADKITLDFIAKNFFISPCYFSRTFKKITGFTFIEYLNGIRIKESQKLLRESNLNITEIAIKVGFTSSTHYGRVFKYITGVSPLTYKKSLQII